MSDIFKLLCQDTTGERKFGICDNKDHERAFIDVADGRNWMAVILNDNRYEATFTAIDNCIEIRRPNGRLESRCEGAITYNNTIIFLEIKERLGPARAWAKDADDQLRITISSIESRIDLDDFTIKKAAITNRLRGNLTEKHTVRMKKFQEDTGYILQVAYRINLD